MGNWALGFTGSLALNVVLFEVNRRIYLAAQQEEDLSRDHQAVGAQVFTEFSLRPSQSQGGWHLVWWLHDVSAVG